MNGGETSFFREVLDYGSPLPLSRRAATSKSGSGLPQSKMLARRPGRLSRFTFQVACVAFTVCFQMPAAETNSFAPGGKVLFDRDVRPILEQNCFRCHGPVKPHSDFSLESRAAALEGGDDNTNDVVPGHSDQSLLIRYVAGLDRDIHMPPRDSGLAPLTPAQVVVLRAWIDEGAPWGTNAGPPALAFALAPELRWIGVHGDAQKFRELEGVPPGFGGGAEHFSLKEQIAPDETFSMEGHALAPENDYKLALNFDKNNVGFIHGGFEEWRKYFDDTGGYYPGFTPSTFSLNRDLYLDNGRAWVDFGLTPRHWPKVVLGYEYQFRQGNESSLAWGAVVQNGSVKSIYPNAQGVNEHTHVFKLDITDGWRGWEFEDHARGEFYRLGESRSDLPSFPILGSTQQMNQKVTYTLGANTFRVAKQLTDWWRVSAGSLYSRYDGTTFFNLTAPDAPGSYWRAEGVTLERDSRVASLASLWLPMKGLSLSAAGQAEWTHEQGFGDVALDFGDPNPALPGTVSANQDQTEFSENLDAQFNRLPRTVVFAEGRLQQESVGQTDAADGGIAAYDGVNAIGQQTDALNHLYDARAGFTSSPWTWLEFGGHYRRRDSRTGYNNLVAEPGNGYPGFITHRDITLNEIAGRLVLRPVVWLSARLTYDWDVTDYSSATATATNFDGSTASPGGPVFDGRTESDQFGLNLTFTPVPRFYFSGAFTYGYSRTTTESAAAPEVAPYLGNTWTVSASAGFALNAKTHLNATYAFSQATYGQKNTAGIPFGLDFARHELLVGLTRQMTRRLSGGLRYQFSDYSEPSSGNVNNFTAHGVFATLAYQWP
jgi:Planctomycete cytochrome C